MVSGALETTFTHSLRVNSEWGSSTLKLARDIEEVHGIIKMTERSNMTRNAD